MSQNQNTVLALLMDYSQSKHRSSLEKNFGKYSSVINKIKYIKNDDWDGVNFPYVSSTYLLDAYFLLPDRVDMAFLPLWQAINSEYSIFCQKTQPFKKGDKESLKYILKELVGNLEDTVGIEEIESSNNLIVNKAYTIKNILDRYIQKLNIKNYRFTAKYILEGLALDEDQQFDKYCSRSFKGFKSDFPVIYRILKKSFGVKYKKITNISIDSDGEVSYGIADGIVSKSLVHALATRIKTLLLNGRAEVIIDSPCGSTQTKEIIRLTDEERLHFLFITILYALRNNSAHGVGASRFGSQTQNSGSYPAALSVFLLGYFFLSLIMYKNNNLKLSDLDVNMFNIGLFE